MERLISAVGFVVILFLAWCCSGHKWKIDFRLVLSGSILQFVIGVIFIKTTFGEWFFVGANKVVTQIIQFSNDGATFLFGPESLSLTAVQILPTIIFVATLSAILFHLGLIQWVVKIMAWVMVRIMNASGIESLVATANIYIGNTEAPLLVKPYLATATRSELMTILTAGMATIAGGVMAAYVGIGASAGHLLTASIMSAPAAIVIAKIMVPEIEESPTKGVIKISPPRRALNFMDAFCYGATDGLMLALNVGVMLMMAVSFISLLNAGLGLFPDVNGSPMTLQRGLGWGFAPLAFFLGVSSEDILTVGSLLGEKTILNEFVAYLDLMKLHAEGGISPRSFIIAQYALCGFANFGSIAIALGGIGQLVPERRSDLARLAVPALIAGTLACFSTACVAGVLI